MNQYLVEFYNKISDIAILEFIDKPMKKFKKIYKKTTTSLSISAINITFSKYFIDIKKTFNNIIYVNVIGLFNKNNGYKLF